ncbi:MAG: hypothetical protein V4738_14200 [Pseudomonadota bacterium]
MQGIRTALSVSVASRCWAALANLIAVPVYVHLMGLEAYGVVGFFASIQVVMSFMDLGLPATLTRELAVRGASPSNAGADRNLVWTFELVYVGITLLVGMVLLIALPPLATYWIDPVVLSDTELGHALLIAGVALACQWPSNLYSAGLTGLHRQTSLAASTSLLAVVRVALTVAFLRHEPTLAAFFWAQLLAGLMQSLVTRWQLLKALPAAGRGAVAQWSVLLSTRSFAGGMTAISVTTIAVTQLDKLVLIHLLPLPEFGIYVIATTVATGMYVLVSPMFLLLYPLFSRLWAQGSWDELKQLYELSGMSMAAMVMPLTAVISVFAAQVLEVWTGNALVAQQGAWVLTFLTLGFALSGLLNISHALQLAAGWTSLSVYINLGAIFFLVPAVWWGAKSYGGVGGAAAWFVLNVVYVVLVPWLTHRRLLPDAAAPWYARALLLPAAASGLTVALLWMLHQPLASRVQTGGQLFFYWIVVSAVTVVSMRPLREKVHEIVRKVVHEKS